MERSALRRAIESARGVSEPCVQRVLRSICVTAMETGLPGIKWVF
jgi:hypothetical protein